MENDHESSEICLLITDSVLNAKTYEEADRILARCEKEVDEFAIRFAKIIDEHK